MRRRKLQLARATKEDQLWIEDLSNGELVKKMKEYNTYIEENCYGIYDMQILELLEREMEKRSLFQ